MSKKDKVQMPATTAGLVRYFDEYKESIQVKPGHILGITVAIIVIEMILRFMAT